MGIAVLGLLSSFAMLLVPVNAAFGDDPLLRLRSVGGPAPDVEVDCGNAIGSLDGSGGVTLYDLARDSACRSAASRRVAIAVAVGALLVLTGSLALVTRGGERPSQPGRWTTA